MDGIPCKDWADFIGPASPAYLSAYCRMQLSHTKTSMSFSAMLFGPFYFFYRKAWKPAFAFLAAELVLALPTFIDLLQITDSSLAPGLSTSTLLTLSRVCSVLSFLLMIVRGLYGKWLYRQSAAEKIRRIRAGVPGRGTAQSRALRSGRHQLGRRARLSGPAHGHWQRVHPAAGSQCGCPDPSGLRLSVQPEMI